jgi:hypothetical protein
MAVVVLPTPPLLLAMVMIFAMVAPPALVTFSNDIAARKV